MKKIKLWRGLTRFGRGLLLVLLGLLAKGAAGLVQEKTFSLLLATIGIIAFITGIYIALVGMDGANSGNVKKCNSGEKRKGKQH